MDRLDACSAAAEHGEQRWYLGYDLKSVIMEYGVFRDAILAVVEEAGHSITIPELRDLTQFLNLGIADAAVEFAEKSTQEISEALRDAQSATLAREEVVAIVSHDLKDPLQVMDTSVAMLVKEIAAPDLNAKRASIEKKLSAIQRASHKMNVLVADLLDLARIRAGKLSSVMRLERIEDLLRDTCEHAAALAEQRSIRLDRQLLSDGSVVCDRARVLQVFANIVGNAIRFGRPNTTVLLRADCSGDECTFEVRDEGEGIPAERIPHLFDRFWRSSDAATQGRGSLSERQGIVEQNGGRIGS